MRRRLWLLVIVLALAGCRKTSPPAALQPVWPFEEVAERAGIDFRLGHPPKLLNILEATGSGCAFLDYDSDGWLDALLIAENRCVLYHNTGRGTFEVSAVPGLPQRGHWICCAVADYDGDGYPDIFLAGYGCACLLHNEQGHGFRDVTAAAGLELPSGETPSFAVSAVWGDFDRDGFPDLYVSRYVEFKPGMNEFCRSQSGHMQTCNPSAYAGQRGVLYRNVGGKRFEDETRRLGADQVHGKAWGALFFDSDDDGWPDLYIANDEEPGDLLHNLKGKRFENRGVAAGVAFDADGHAHGGMGVAAGDYNGDGRLDLVVTTFVNEAYSLYRNNGGGTFTDVAGLSGIGQATGPMVGWATRFLDYDNDGQPDLFFVNGHATDSDLHPDARSDMAQPMQLFRNQGGSFTAVPLGPVISAPIVGRGAAFGDYDNDGFVDALVIDMEGRAQLLHNTGARRGAHWLGIELKGRRSNTMGLGARVTVRAGGRTQTAEVTTGGGVFSSSDPRAVFGLGTASSVDEATVRWPSGMVDRIANPIPNRYLAVTEGAAAGQGSAASAPKH